jgi:hypothetical protein
VTWRLGRGALARGRGARPAAMEPQRGSRHGQPVITRGRLPCGDVAGGGGPGHRNNAGPVKSSSAPDVSDVGVSGAPPLNQGGWVQVGGRGELRGQLAATSAHIRRQPSAWVSASCSVRGACVVLHGHAMSWAWQSCSRRRPCTPAAGDGSGRQGVLCSSAEPLLRRGAAVSSGAARVSVPDTALRRAAPPPPGVTRAHQHSRGGSNQFLFRNVRRA